MVICLFPSRLTHFCVPRVRGGIGGGGRDKVILSLKELFICFILMLYTESPNMPATCQKICDGGWCVFCICILVSALFKLNNK